MSLRIVLMSLTRLSRALFLLSFLLPATVSAHTSPYTELSFDRIGVENGLSNGSVNSISQGQDGFMWFGTEDGLNRYDGRSFVIYRHEQGNPNSLSSSNFGATLQDSRGRLWLGTWGGGLNRLDLATGEFTRFAAGEGPGGSFQGARTEFLFEDAAGDIWIGTESSGLNRYRSAEDRFQHFSHDPADPNSLGSDSVKAIAQTADGKIWVGTDNGLFLFRPGEDRFERQEIPGTPGAGGERVRSIALAADGALWIGTRGDGLKYFDPDKGTWIQFRHDPESANGLSENAIARVFEDSQGIVWIATYTSGLDRLDPKTGRFRNYDYTTDASDEGISFRRIDAIFEDRGGVLWFGTRGGGINKVPVRPKGFRNYRYFPEAQHSLPHPTVRSIAGQMSEEGERIWIGTDGGGLARLDLADEHFEVYGPRPDEPGGLADGRVWTVLADRHGRVWAGTYSEGLHLLENPLTGRFRRFVHKPGRADSLSHNRVHALLEARNGDLWVGTRQGLDRLQSLTADGASFQHFRHDPRDPRSLSSDHITALMQDHEGLLWVGTRQGLNILDPQTGLVTRYAYVPDDPDSLSDDQIMSLFQDSSGTVWVGTAEGGLNRFDREYSRFQRFPKLTEASGGKIAGILSDESGRLWLATGRGLSRFAPDSGLSRSFGASDGLRTLSFLGSAAYVSRTGELFFGGLQGMVSFNPLEVFENLHPPTLEFTAISRFDPDLRIQPETSAAGPLIRLQHDSAFVRFEYAALDFLDPLRNQYAHKLEGIDLDWVNTGNQNTASYSGLTPGNYVFRVRASNSDGIWNNEGISMRLEIAPPYWQTWWFRVLAVLVAGLLLYATYVLRVRVIRAKSLQLENLNNQLLSQMHERNRMEGEREALIMELEARNAEMERFTYTVSHDLKSPLITIRGFLGLLREDYRSGRAERVRSDLDKIESATTKMDQLLDELLRLSRAGKVIDNPEEIAFRKIVDDVLKLARGEVDGRGVTVTVHDDLPIVYVDRVRFAEALLNLLSNAVRFMGPQLHPNIEIGIRGVGDSSVFFVRDNGIGIEGKHHQRIFGLFERLDPETPGTGIGLALVKRIIELHGGEVWAESEGPGTGSTFCFTLASGSVTDISEPDSTADRKAS